MSCWVVPTVAAEYWGVTLDVVWRRIYEGLIPHKNDRGFIFVDVDPWTPASDGRLQHEPPPTFVTPQEPLLHETPRKTARREEAATVSAGGEQAASAGTAMLLAAQGDAEDEEDVAELPPLDEEETATFGRLSWHDVRERVSRTRRPPPAFRD